MSKKLSLITSILILLGLSSCFSSSSGGGGEHTHNFGEWNTTIQASCINEGEERRQCVDCGYEEIRHTNFTDHNYHLDHTEEPTCYSPGRKVYVCQFCNNSYDEIIYQIDHTYVEESRVEPSCNSNGYVRFVCTQCGKSYEEPLVKDECEFIVAEVQDATCMENGYIRYVCTENPEHFYEEVIPTEGKHKPIYNFVEKGHAIICEYCGESFGPFEQHQMSDWVNETDPTCFESGFAKRNCVCGYSEYKEVLPTHTYDGDVCSICNDHKPSDGLVYELNKDDTYSVKSIGTCTDKHIYIPSIYNGKYVTSISKRAFADGSFTDITIPTSVINFGEAVFYGCEELINVYYAGQFIDWFNVNFTTSSSNNNYSTPMIVAEHIYFLNEAKEYYELTEIVIPESITTISQFLFAYFKNVTNIEIHENVTNIEMAAFINCDSITSINIPANVKMVNSTFYSCDNLETVTYNEGATTVAYSNFFGCSKLKTVNLASTIKTIESTAFYKCTGLTDIVIPEGVEVINSAAFYDCESLESISLPNSLKSMGASVFDGCGNLSYYTENNEYYLGNDTNKKLVLIFVNDEEITSYTVDDNVKIVYHLAFDLCENLIDLNIHSNVTSIGIEAFRYLSKLEVVELPWVGYDGNIEPGSLDYFFGDKDIVLKKITINNGITLPGYSLENISSLEEVVIADTFEIIGENILYNSNSVKSLTMPLVTDNQSFTLSNVFGSHNYSLEKLNISKAKYVNTGLFNGLDGILEVVLPNELKGLYYSEHINVELPYNVYENGNYLGSKDNPYLLFMGLVDNTLTSVKLHADTKIVHPNAFADSNYEYMIYEGVKYFGDETNPFKFACGLVDNVSNVVLHEDTEVVLEKAFDNALDTLTIPKNVKQMFDINAPGLISKVYYAGTISDWTNIEFNLAETNPMYYSDEFYYLDNSEYKLLDKLEIPSDVEVIGDYQFVGLEVSEIIINSNVTSIGKYAFAYAKNLNKIVYNGSLDYIPKGAFLNSNNINIVIIGDFVNKIESYAFDGFKIDSLYLSKSVKIFEEYAFDGCYNLFYNGELVDWLENKFIGRTSTPAGIYGTYFVEDFGAYDGNYDSSCLMNNIVIPAGVTEIGDYQFAGFGLYEVSLPIGLIKIGKHAFANNYLSSVELPNSLEEIWDYAFGYNNINELVLPNFLDTIHQFAFISNSLVDIYVPDSVTYIGAGIVKNNSIESISLPFLGEDGKDTTDANIMYTFGDFNYVPTSLFNVEVRGGILGEGAFYNIRSIKKVSLPNITEIPAYTFSYCEMLNELSGLDSIINVGEFAFDYCGLDNIYLPKSLRYVEENGFEHFYAQNIYYAGTIGDWAKIGFENLYSNPKYYAQDIYFLNDNNEYHKIEKIEFGEDITIIGNYQFVNFNGLKEVVLSPNITYMGEASFINCYDLKKLTIPFMGSNVDDINGNLNYLFSCSLTVPGVPYLEELTILGGNYIGSVGTQTLLNKVILPSSATTYFSNAFGETYNICEVYFDGTIEDWCKISFADSVANPISGPIAKLHLKDNNDSYYEVVDVVIPDSIVDILDYTFFDMSLKNVYLHENIQSFGIYSFSGFDIENIYYGSDILDWFNIEYGPGLEYAPLLNAKNIYFTDNGEYELLTEVEIPLDVVNVYNKIVGLNSVEILTIPNSVKYLESTFVRPYSEDFAGWASLESIYYDGTLAEYLTLNIGTGEVPLHKLYLKDNNDEYYLLENLVIDESLDTNIIQSSQFEGVSSLKTVNINVDRIESEAFYNCPNIMNISLTSDLFSYGKDAFEGINETLYTVYENGLYLGNSENPYLVFISAINSDIKEMVIHEDTIILEEGSLVSCRELVKLTTPIAGATNKDTSARLIDLWDYWEGIPTSLKELVVTRNKGISAFECSSLESVTFEKGFDYYQGSIEAPTGLKKVIVGGESKLDGFVNFISKSRDTLEYNVYGNCNYLGNEDNPYLILVSVYDYNVKEFMIHPDCQGILDLAFQDYLGVYTMDIPEGVTYIGCGAFMGCLHISQFIIPNSVTYIGGMAFERCNNLSSIVIPDSVTYIGPKIFNGCEYLNVVTIPFIGEDVNHPAHIKYLFSYTNDYYTNDTCSKITITKGTVVTGFANCTSIAEVIYKNAKTMQEEAFSHSSVTSVILEGELEEVAKLAFDNCNNLTNVVLPDTIKYIRYAAFYQCGRLTKLDLPSNLIEVEDMAFYLNAIEYLIVPETCISMGEWYLNQDIIYYFEGEVVISSGYACETYGKGEWAIGPNGKPYVI